MNLKNHHVRDMKGLCDKFKKLTGIKPPLDGFMTAAAGEPTVDIVAFDKAIRNKVGKDIPFGKSLNDFVKTELGEEAYKLFNKITK